MPISNPPILKLSRITIDVDLRLIGFRQEIIPAEPGAEALVIKDATGVIDRIVLYEDGSVVSRKIEVSI